jgi:hypothetical protein
MYIDPEHCDTPVENVLEISQILLKLLNDSNINPTNVFDNTYLTTLIMDRSMTLEYLNGDVVMFN